MSSNYSLERDLKELQKMGDVLKKYIPSDELYMSVGGGFFSASSMPQLTTGAFLLRLRRLNHFRDQMTDAQKAIVDNAIEQNNTVRKDWTVHYEQKMTREGLSRLKAMTEFFRECRDSMKTCANVYAPEALRRTIVQELLMAMDDYGFDKKDIITQSHQTDNEFRRWITAGEFIWSEQLQAVYPRTQFWWLYGRPQADD